MRRIVWVAVGAAGGILAYRRAQLAIADARERGIVLSAQQAGLTAAAALSAARGLATSATQRSAEAPRLPGAAAARVVAGVRRSPSQVDQPHVNQSTQTQWTQNQESGRGLRRDP